MKRNLKDIEKCSCGKEPSLINVWKYEKNGNPYDAKFYIVCLNCKNHTRLVRFKQKAIDLWNNKEIILEKETNND